MHRFLRASLLMLAAASAAGQTPLGTDFMYQGQLLDAGNPANGDYDLEFRLFSTPSGGAPIGTICRDGVVVVDGALFVSIDFGSQFNGNQRFLELAVRPDSTAGNCAVGAYTTLSPRQPLTGTPYALYALDAGDAVRLNGQLAGFYQDAANLTAGTLPSGRLSGNYPLPLTFASPSNAFFGNGAGLTNPNAGNLAIGTLPSARLAGAYTSAVTLNNPANAFSGDGAGLTNLNASQVSGGTLAASRLPFPLVISGNAGALGCVQGTTTGLSGAGIYGNASAATGVTSGVWGESSSSDGVGVRGIAWSATGFTYAGYFQHASTAGSAVRGLTTATSGTTIAGEFENSSTSGTAVYGHAIPASGTTFGGDFISGSSSGTGVRAQAIGGGTGVGVYGVTNGNGTVAKGVYGKATSPSGFTLGVHGESASTDGAGGYFQATATSGATYGVYAADNSPNGKAVWGWATSASGSPYGVHGQAQSASGWGVYATGRMGASGTKSFCIDHPADPSNKYLLHYSSEAPEPQNFYNGIATLDANGEAVIALPGYFSAINRDPRYTLTAIGAAMPMLHVADEISAADLAAGDACWFRVRGGAPGGRVSWEVKAIRNDAWLRAYGAPVEVDKTGSERGKYQHPELYGQPAELGINFVAEQLLSASASASPGGSE